MTETTAQDPARFALATYAGKAYEKPNDVTTALTRLAEEFPVVAPGGTTKCAVIADGYKALVTSVVAYAPENKDAPGDVYKDALTGKWCFHAAFLKKLAAGVGIEWLAEKTRRLDNFAHPFVCSMVVAGRYRDYSGEWREITGSHMLDLRDEAAHGMKDKQLAGARRTIQQRCETMAKSRAIADACVSRTIEDRDLGRPIIMAKLYRADPIDPGEARAALYGGGESIDDSTGEVVKEADATVSDSSAQGKAASPSPSSGAAAPTAPASPAPSERPATSFACKVSASYPKEALRKKPLADLTDADLSAYVDWSEHRITTEAPGWPKESREGAQKAMNAAYAEVAWREAQKGGGSKSNGGEW